MTKGANNEYTGQLTVSSTRDFPLYPVNIYIISFVGGEETGTMERRMWIDEYLTSNYTLGLRISISFQDEGGGSHLPQGRGQGRIGRARGKGRCHGRTG